MSGQKPEDRYVKDIDLCAVDDSTFGPDEVGEVLVQLGPIASNFFMFGVLLHVKYNIMNEIRDNYGKKQNEALREVLMNYALGNFVEKYGPPTYRKIVAAVSSSAGGANHRLAKEFASKHPFTSVREKVTSHQESSSDHRDVTAQRNQEEALGYQPNPPQPPYSGQQPPPSGYPNPHHTHHNTAPGGPAYHPDQQPHPHLTQTQSTPILGQTPHPQMAQRNVSCPTGPNAPPSAGNYGQQQQQQQQQPQYPQQGQYQYRSHQGYNQQQQLQYYQENAGRQPGAMSGPPGGQQSERYSQPQQSNPPPARSQQYHATQEIVTGHTGSQLSSPSRPSGNQSTTISRPYDNRPATTPSTASEGKPSGKPLYVGLNVKSDPIDTPDSPDPVPQNTAHSRRLYENLPLQGNSPQAGRGNPPSQGNSPHTGRGNPPSQGNPPQVNRTPPQQYQQPLTHGAPPGTSSPYNTRQNDRPSNQQLPQNRATQNITFGIGAMNIGNPQRGPPNNSQYSPAPASQQQHPAGNARQQEQRHGETYNERYQVPGNYNDPNLYTQRGGQYAQNQGQWALTENETLSTGDFSSSDMLTNSSMSGIQSQMSFASSTTSESTLESSVYESSIGDPNSSFASNTSSITTQPSATGGIGDQPLIDDPGTQSLTKHEQHGYESPSKTREESRLNTSEPVSESFPSGWSSHLPTSVPHSEENVPHHGANPGPQGHAKAMTSSHPTGKAPNSAASSGESFQGGCPDIIRRQSMQSQISHQTKDHIGRQSNTLSAKTMESRQNFPSKTILEVPETESVLQRLPQLTESALPPQQSHMSGATAFDPNVNPNLEPASFNSTASNRTGIAYQCTSIPSSISESQDLPQNHASPHDIQEGVKLKPIYYNPPYISGPIIPPEQEYRENEIVHKEAISSASTMQHENEQPIRYQEGFSYTPSEAGGATRHDQCTSIPHTDQSLQQPVTDQLAANLPEGEPTPGEMAQDDELRLDDLLEELRPTVDGGGSMQSFQALCLRGEDRYKKIPLSFKTLIPERGPRNISNQAEYYPMDNTPHGLAVIINNEHFVEHDHREGTDIDEMNLIITFRFLGYNVEVYRDLTTAQIQDLFEEIQKRDHSASDSFVCCILTHGKSGQVFGTDSSSIPIDTLTEKLSASNCPQLRGKPKIFFIQACRGKLKCRMVSTDSGPGEDDRDSFYDENEPNNEEEEQTDGSAQVSQDSPAPVCKLKRAISRSLSIDLPDSESEAPRSRVVSDSDIPDSADFFFGFATPSGQVAWRDLDHGSWYISELCRHLCTYCATLSLSDIMFKVHNGVGDKYFYKNFKQAPETTHRLRKKVLF